MSSKDDTVEYVEVFVLRSNCDTRSRIKIKPKAMGTYFKPPNRQHTKATARTTKTPKIMNEYWFINAVMAYSFLDGVYLCRSPLVKHIRLVMS